MGSNWLLSFFASVEVHLIYPVLLLFFFVKLSWKSRWSKAEIFRTLTPLRILLIGTFITGVVLFMAAYCHTIINPLEIEVVQQEQAKAIQTDWLAANPLVKYIAFFLISCYRSVQLFVTGADLELVKAIVGLDIKMKWFFVIYPLLLSLFAPALTVALLLSVFSNVTDYVAYLFRFRRDAYIFSELNDKSLALAESIAEMEAGKRPVIVFTGVTDPDSCQDMVRKLRNIHAHCYRRSITQVGFRHHSKKAALCFFVLGENESSNAKTGLDVIRAYGQRENTRLYVLSMSHGTELMLHTTNRQLKGKMVIRCINDARSLVYHTLYKMVDETRKGIFSRSDLQSKGDTPISALVVGMGLHGTEMLKALCWFCQMDGYTLRLDAVDMDDRAESRLQAQCPELIAKSSPFKDPKGDAQCDIHIHAGVDVLGSQFADMIQELPNVSYVFVALGDDDINIRTALMIRMQFQRKDKTPLIHAIVYDSERRKALENIVNFKGSPYDIDFIGDLRQLYSCDVILHSKLERQALYLHSRVYNKDKDPEVIKKSEQDFWAYEYNYWSSMASVIHCYARTACGIPKADRGRLEHSRWNAYMRAEGYQYGKERNDLGKRHPDLVPYKDLSDKEKSKDIDIAELRKGLIDA